MTRILVVEDEGDIREDICTILELEGYITVDAANGKEALAKIQEEVPDFIFSDVVMPEMTGLELLQELRNNPAYASIPFVFLSARTSDADIKQALDSGANDYLKKPFSSEDLLATIDKFLP